MKKLLLILLAVALVFTMTVVGCDDSPTNKHQTNDAPQTVKYESIDASGNTYILTITEKTSRAAYTVTKGDSYTLTIKQQGQPDKESKGTVSTIKDDGELTMKPKKEDSEPFGVSVNDGKMTAITGTITLEDGGKIQAPGAVTPVGSGGDEIIGVGNVGGPFTSIADMAAWLSAQPANTPASAHTVKLNVSDLGGDSDTSGSAGYVLRANSDKYVNLDLSSSTMTSIGDNAFWGCRLTSITIPNSVTSIGGFAFSGKSLTNVIIPDSITSIGYGAFVGCTSLTSITVDAGNTAYSSQDGVLYNKDKTALHTYLAGKKEDSFIIPNSVTSIGNAAFYGCTSLTSVTIPNSVTSIGVQAFENCTSLTAITVSADNTAYSSLDGVLYNKDKTVLNAYPAGKREKTFTIPNSVTSIGGTAFSACYSLTSVTIGSGVTSIGWATFSGCTSLTNVTFQSTITADNFNIDAFENLGDLRNKYLAGGIGTYTTTAPVDKNSVWTKK